MVEQIPTQAGQKSEVPAPRAADASSLHIASGKDVLEATRRDDRLDAILARGDIRDQAAERRDRSADSRVGMAGSGQAEIDRDWAGRDRDLAAADRADLVELLHAGPPEPPPLGVPG